MLSFLESAVEKEIDSISVVDQAEHGSVLCESWPVAQVALTSASAMVKNIFVQIAIALVMALLSGLVKKFCKEG